MQSFGLFRCAEISLTRLSLMQVRMHTASRCWESTTHLENGVHILSKLKAPGGRGVAAAAAQPSARRRRQRSQALRRRGVLQLLRHCTARETRRSQR